MTTTVEQVLARRIREVREARRLSQRQLAQALRAVGSPLGHKATVAKVETLAKTTDEYGRSQDGPPRRAVKASELLDLACVLLVPPMELLTPTDLDERVRSPWGALTGRQLRFRMDPWGEYVKGAQQGRLDDEPIVMSSARIDPTDGAQILTSPSERSDDREDER